MGESLKAIRQRFGTKLGGHVREQEEFARICAPDILFDQREVQLGNIEVIPTPGHTPGSTCFLVHSAQGQRYLFTGDTLYTWR
ncbi:MBL fold metallo-hydrolase [Sedimenticola hydrogenitrophicus]|uniref:MBL fold metallo-hydrolase n=1 Tax=Sedimenticola hydrogenitrophicus TaxID=2967975 RepID=UPI0023B14D27|nr:MBL fold metallo-hydrolase [Sedimenticola hydrogenitrophicus]